MTTKNNNVDSLYAKLSVWLNDVKTHELTSLIEFTEQAKKYLMAAEALPEEKINQFINNLSYDLKEFFQQSKNEAQHSIYLGLLEEQFWQELSKITDKSQVEWSEMLDEIKHHGDYSEGDIIGFGVLVCKHCQQQVEYFHQSTVIACPNCQKTEFFRQNLTP
ncbi:MAG: zinc ribbon-containing protein [Alteromonadaceae bacterium]|nr:zinc ribbon-containing protein [Alteromonadaceae bacterium]